MPSPRISRPLRRRRPSPHGDDGPSRLWALDLETTGLDADLDQIVEVGLVPIVDRRLHLGRSWSSLVRPEAYRSDGTVAHQIMQTDLVGAPPPASVIGQMWELIGSDPVLVHHARLDVAFLRRLHLRLGWPWPDPQVIDTVDLLERRNRRLRRLGEPELPLQLGQARLALGLPAASEHRAIDDAAATAELWLALTASAAAGFRR